MTWDKAKEEHLTQMRDHARGPGCVGLSPRDADALDAVLAEIKRLRKLNDDQRMSDAATYTRMIEQQRERADRAEAALLDRRQGYDAPVPGLAEARGRIATLEAALGDIRREIGTALHETQDYKGTVSRIDWKFRVGAYAAALAAQPAQEPQQCERGCNPDYRCRRCRLEDAARAGLLPVKEGR